MRLGLLFDLRNPPQWRRSPRALYAHTLELVREAERLGLASAWFSEHHGFEDGYLTQPLTMAAAAAASTQRIRIGTAVLLAPLRDPTHITEEATIVDLVSGGRLELGLGAGYSPEDFNRFGIDRSQRFSRLEEAAIRIRALWGSPELTPPPVQEDPPLWLAAQTEVGARRAGRLGAGMLALRPDLWPTYAEALTEAGHHHTAARVGGPAHLFLSDDPDRDFPILAPHIQYQWELYAQAASAPDDPRQGRVVDVEEWQHEPLVGRLPHFRVCTPETAAELLTTHLHGCPVEHVLIWATVPGAPERLTAAHLELAASRLMPLLSS